MLRERVRQNGNTSEHRITYPLRAFPVQQSEDREVSVASSYLCIQLVLT